MAKKENTTSIGFEEKIWNPVALLNFATLFSLV